MIKMNNKEELNKQKKLYLRFAAKNPKIHDALMGSIIGSFWIGGVLGIIIGIIAGVLIW